MIHDEDIHEFMSRKSTAASHLCYDEPTSGPEAFDLFVDQVMMRALADFESRGDGRVIPVGFLHNEHEMRVFEPNEGETVRIFFERLQHEAAMMSATWFGTVMTCPSATRVVEVDQHDQASIDEAKRRGELTYNLCWLVDADEPDFRKRRCGLWPINTDGRLEPLIEADPISAPDLFIMVLHPDEV